MNELQITWYMIIGLMFSGFVVLSGTDLGLGIWYIFAKDAESRKAILRSIAPYWDGNGVWLVAAGALLFAAFPPVYAALFSALYIPIMLLLFSIIFRDVSIEFADHAVSENWQRVWGMALGIGSLLIVLIFGIGIGNVMHGISMDSSQNFSGTIPGLFNWYAILTGMTGLAMVATHGAIFGTAKTSGARAAWFKSCGYISWAALLFLYVATAIATAKTQPHLMINYVKAPLLWPIPIVTFAVIIATGIFNALAREREALMGSTISIVGVMATISLSLFPRLLPALNSSQRDLTAANASASNLTLLVMLPITLIGMSIVIAYTIYARKPFRDKISRE